MEMTNNEMVRVLFVCASGGNGRLQLGGAERFLMDMLPVLADAMEVRAVVSDERIAKELDGHGIRCIVHRPKGRFDLEYMRTIREACRSYEPTVVSAHLLSAAMHVRAVAALGGIQSRVVVTLHNSMRQYVTGAAGFAKFRSVLNLGLERLFRCLIEHESVAVSDFEYRELVRTFHRGDIRRIHNSLPANWLGREYKSKGDARETLGLPADKKVLLYLGRMEHEKGVDRLQPIAQSLPEDWVMVTVGHGSLSVSGENIISFPHSSQPRLHYDASDVVVVPSRVESFGRVALEAAASGRPVVNTGVGGLREVLSGYEGSLSWVTDGRPSNIVRQVLCAERYAEANEDSIIGLSKEIARRFSFARMVDGWQRLLNRAC